MSGVYICIQAGAVGSLESGILNDFLENAGWQLQLIWGPGSRKNSGVLGSKNARECVGALQRFSGYDFSAAEESVLLLQGGWICT